MQKKKNTISVGILGFGGRAFAYDRLTVLFEDENISRITLFWNQPTEAMKGSLAEAGKLSEKIIVVLSESNTGSAGGYSRLIEDFRDNQSTGHLLLLDDDLLLGKDCIEQLMAASESMESESGDCLFSAYRKNLPEIRALVEDKTGICRPRNSCCVAFHAFNVIRPHREPVRFSENTGLFVIDSAPWGGLMIPRAALARLGLPREDFFLYAEDSEITHRFTRNGGTVLLVSRAIIEDVEPAWNTIGGSMSNLKRRVLLLPEIKVFHEVRNRNYMARHYYPGYLPMYWLNKFLFLLSAYSIAILNGRFSRARLIHRAINEGERMAACEAGTSK